MTEPAAAFRAAVATGHAPGEVAITPDGVHELDTAALAAWLGVPVDHRPAGGVDLPPKRVARGACQRRAVSCRTLDPLHVRRIAPVQRPWTASGAPGIP